MVLKMKNYGDSLKNSIFRGRFTKNLLGNLSLPSFKKKKEWGAARQDLNIKRGVAGERG